MARTRTTAETVSVTTDTLQFFGVHMAHNADGTVNPDGVRFRYKIANRESDGTIIEVHDVFVNFADWPAAVKTDIKDLYSKVLTHAENNGYIGAGTDSDDLP